MFFQISTGIGFFRVYRFERFNIKKVGWQKKEKKKEHGESYKNSKLLVRSYESCKLYKKRKLASAVENQLSIFH